MPYLLLKCWLSLYTACGQTNILLKKDFPMTFQCNPELSFDRPFYHSEKATDHSDNNKYNTEAASAFAGLFAFGSVNRLYKLG